MKNEDREIEQATQEIRTLAGRVLAREDFASAAELGQLIFRDQHMRWHVIEEVQKHVGMAPKDPVYYLNQELKKLPRETRDVAWYAGEYIHRLVRPIAYKKGKFLWNLNFLRKRALQAPLGENLRRLEGALPADLYETLLQFNDFVYMPLRRPPAKDSGPTAPNTPDTIFICFMIKPLAEMVMREGGSLA